MPSECTTEVALCITSELTSTPDALHGIQSFPAGKLFSGSEVNIESLVILEFLADLYPDASLLPKDAVKCSQARIFMNTLEPKMADDIAKWLLNQDDGQAFFDLLETLQAMMPAQGYVIGEWPIADLGAGRLQDRSRLLREDQRCRACEGGMNFPSVCEASGILRRFHRATEHEGDLGRGMSFEPSNALVINRFGEFLTQENVTKYWVAQFAKGP